MLDNRNMAENDGPEQVTVESPATETKAPVEAPKEEVITPQEEPKAEIAETPAENIQEETPAQQPQEQPVPKPSRAERRIRDLVAENKELEERIKQFSPQTPTETPNPFAGQEYIDPAQLDALINQRAAEAAQLVLAKRDTEEKFKSELISWADDLEQTVKNNPVLDPKSPEFNPELETTLRELVENANYDERGNIRPRVKTSEIWGRIQKALNVTQTKAKAEGQKEATVTLAKQMAEGAVTPSNKASKTEEYTPAEIEKIAAENPRLYTELIMKGKI